MPETTSTNIMVPTSNSDIVESSLVILNKVENKLYQIMEELETIDMNDETYSDFIAKSKMQILIGKTIMDSIHAECRLRGL